MHHAAAGGHRLDIAHAQDALCPGGVLVGDGAFADIGHDFEIAVAVHGKTGARRDRGVGQHPQRAEPEDGRAGVFRRAAKMVADAKSRRIDAAQFSEGGDSDHEAVKMR